PVRLIRGRPAYNPNQSYGAWGAAANAGQGGGGNPTPNIWGNDVGGWLGGTPSRSQQNSDFLSNTSSGLPAPNQTVYRNWVRLPQSTRDLALSGWESQGYDRGDVQNTISQLGPGTADQGGVGVRRGTYGRVAV